MVRGPANHRMDYVATFLVNTRNQKTLRFPANLWTGPSFSRSGQAALSIPPLVKTAIFDMRGAALSDMGEVHTQDLRNPRRDTGTGIETSVRSIVAISDDQHRLAIFDPMLVLSVHDVQRHALLGSVRIPNGEEGNLFFVSPDVVRIYMRKWWMGKVPPNELWIYEFNVTSRHLEQTGYLKTEGPFGMRVSSDGSTILLDTANVTSRRSRTLLILDARTGVERARIESEIPLGFSQLLADGGVAAVGYPTRFEPVLRIFDARGTHIRDVPLGGISAGGIREIVAARKLIATVARTRSTQDVVEIDLQKGVVDRIQTGAAGVEDESRDDPRISEASMSGEYMVVTGPADHHQMWRYNALTGTKTRVL